MILIIDHEHEYLDKLSEHERKLALFDLIAYGSYCIEDNGGQFKRLDIRGIVLSNGRIHKHEQVKFLSAIGNDPYVQAIVAKRERPKANWDRLIRDSLYGVDTSQSSIWKNQDPGAT